MLNSQLHGEGNKHAGFIQLTVKTHSSASSLPFRRPFSHCSEDFPSPVPSPLLKKSVLLCRRLLSYSCCAVASSSHRIMNKKNGKASWDIKATKVFIDLCIEEVEKGGRRGTSLTKPAWTSIEENFTAKTGRVYTRIQLKNKYDTLRKEWQLWDRLLRETGLGWDAERNTVSTPDDWWEKKIVEVPGYEKFRERGLQFRAELTQLFGSVAATGPQSWAPSSMTLPSEGVPENDMEEGSGDSDEILGTNWHKRGV
ncbi:L10-interacting MYB domain-containing protein-like [Neltuma alba]|uniref:L10-interacting MYB domain-containing protein-like n=1 Tax=Neltuma alba TaxID=207710 RepID=UPI0010A396EA|nr:L10-interacting MYB domain-containing protein-like [Prosopis alba]